MDRQRLNNVIALVSRLIGASGYECIEAEWAGDQRILRLFVDRALADGAAEPAADGKGGVNLDDCVKISKLIDESSELDELISGAYTLEVSSPGVERPQRRRRDFEQHIGETVEVKLTDRIEDRRHGTGKLVDVAGKDDAAIITLETKRGPWSFPLASLQRASLVFDWNAR
jgi:ribosome maturation factor RimP